MKYQIEWGKISRKHKSDPFVSQADDYNPNGFSEETLKAIDDLTDKFPINKETLDYFKNIIKADGVTYATPYDEKGKQIDPSEIISIANKCNDYISGEIFDLSFLKNIETI